ncbi:hypothetical protein GEMRC1_003488 [Eukaryota sp. GEM-RC1]
MVTLRLCPFLGGAEPSAWVSEGDSISSLSSGLSFSFDRVFGPATSNKEVFAFFSSHILSKAIHGSNVTFLTVGPPKSGKSYTLFGSPQDPGIIPLTLSLLGFRRFRIQHDPLSIFLYGQFGEFISSIVLFEIRTTDIQLVVSGLSHYLQHNNVVVFGSIRTDEVESSTMFLNSLTNFNIQPLRQTPHIRNVLEDTVDVESYFSCSSPSPAEEVPKPKELSVSHLKLTDLILQSSVTVFKAKHLVLGLIPAVIKMLKCHDTLKELDLTKSSVNDDHCLTLAEALDSAQLSRLLLGQNSITSIGISNLVKCLPPSLKVLDLSCKCLNPEGVLQLPMFYIDYKLWKHSTWTE